MHEQTLLINNQSLAQTAACKLQAAGIKITTVESCSGGLLAGLFTSFDGSSSWFDRGFVTYSNQAKQDQVGVCMASITEYGAVSKEVAKQMAQGGLANSEAELAVSVTGVAGPAGGSTEKPVGTVCIAVAGSNNLVTVRQFEFAGDREGIRAKSVNQALLKIIEFVSN
jgi:nicotinamide-nucleotide amidase